MHYYQFNIKTYIASTAHLTNEEDLTYRRLIDHYYDTEQPIPSALPVLCRRLRLALPDVESVLKEFFFETENGWAHTYINNEIAAYKAFIARQKANGSKGGRASKPSANPVLTQANPSAKPTSNHKQVTINNKPITNTSNTTADKPLEGFNKFWTQYPNTDRKQAKGKCLDVWRKAGAELEAEVILTHIDRLKKSNDWTKNNGEYIPAPLVYLNQKRWQGSTMVESRQSEYAGML